ncbi:MAG: ABC transporter permease [Balneola sp.]
MFKNYIKIALRNLKKHKGYSFINIAGLSIGISLCLLILAYVKHEISYDSFHEKSDRIVRINLIDEDSKNAVTPSMVAPTLDFISNDIDKWVRLYEPTKYSPVIISTENEKFQEESFLYADSSFFEMFSFELLAGNTSTALKMPRSLVLTEAKALKLFGTTDVLGKTVNGKIFNTDYDFEVTGVVKNIPSNSHFKFDYLGSLNTMQNWSQLSDTEIKSANFYTYILLNPESTKESLEKRINEYLTDNMPEDRTFSLAAIPLEDMYLHSDFDYEIAPMGSIQNVYGFSFLAFLILIIGIINYINLATARSARRASEVGIRKTLGALKSQLIKQFYGESIVLTLIAISIAVLLVEVFKDPFFNLMGQNIQFDLFTDPNALLMLFGITLVTALLAGSYPALLLSSYEPVKVLKGIFGKNSSDGILRKGLVVFQFMISTFLILGTIIIYLQTDFILNKNLGFNKEEVIVLPARDRELASKQDILKSEILKQSGVVGAAYMSNIPGKTFGGYYSEHIPNSESILTNAGAGDMDLVNTLGLELIAGNGFPQNPNYTKEQGYVYLLNEQLAKAHGWSPEEAVGKSFNVLGNREGEVVGVIKDFNFASLREQVEPLALFVNADMYNYLLVKVAPENISNTLASLRNVWSNIAPHRPFEYQFMDQQLDELYKSELETRNLLSLFSGLAIFIACLGLVGLSSFIIEKRAKEIGIRKVLGASVSNIVTLLSSDFIKLVVIGFVVASPIAWFTMDKWLQNFAFKIDITISIFIYTALVALVVTIVTVSWQSIKAALTDPVKSLKSE